MMELSTSARTWSTPGIAHINGLDVGEALNGNLKVFADAVTESLYTKGREARGNNVEEVVSSGFGLSHERSPIAPQGISLHFMISNVQN